MIRRPPKFVLRRGFTVVELLVSIAIVGLLTSLLLPAVQCVRENSRNMDCRSRLHQFGIAMHLHEGVHRVFPTSGTMYSRIAEQAINPPTFWKCPSDRRYEDGEGYTSYLINDGVDLINGKRGNGFNAARFFWRIGAFDLRASEVTDGLSQTAAVAERLISPPGDVVLDESALRADPKRYLWYLPAIYPTIDSLALACRNDRTTPYPFQFPTCGVWANTGYDHILGPNEIGCQPDSSIPGSGQYAIPASSEHSGTVNVLMGDGAVRTVADGIDIPVWRAIGTRNGNEVVGEF